MDPVIVWIARLATALLFAVAAFHKARAPRVFAATLLDYRLLPEALVPVVAPGILVAEALLALGLLIPQLGAAAGLGAAVVLAVYSAGIAINLGRGRTHIDCGCLGPAQRQPLSGWLLVRNGVLLAGAFVAAMPASGRSPTWVDIISVVGAVTSIALLFHAANTLAAQAQVSRRLRRSA